MSNSAIRRFSKSFQDSLRRLGSIDASRRPNQSNSSWVYKNDQWVLKYEDGEEVNLTYVKHERVPMKDFAYEVRATLDVGHFLNHAVLLLDLSENSLEGVVEAMLTKVFQNAKEQFCSLAEVKASLFSNDSVHLLSRTIQGTSINEGSSSFEYDQSWICAMVNLTNLTKRHVAIARLKQPVNFGSTCFEVRFFIVILCPSKEKGTKNAWEMGRTYSTIFSDMEFRQSLLEASTEEDFKQMIIQQAGELSERQSRAKSLGSQELEAGEDEDTSGDENWWRFGRGVLRDLQRRLPHYWSDYTDGIAGKRSIQKTVSTTCFLYFACILPSIAFGVLNDQTTNGIIDVKKVIVGQTIGGLLYAIFSGQPLNIILTTAPLCLFVKIVYALAEQFEVSFEAFYCCVGLWNSLFTILFAFFNVSRLMKWSTRSTEEIFALFITIAFFHDAFKDAYKQFRDNYFTPQCRGGHSEFMVDQPNVSYVLHSNNSSIVASLTTTIYNVTGMNYTGLGGDTKFLNHSIIESLEACHRDSSLLFLLLMLGTLWLGIALYNFNKTPYLQASKREALADYALPVAVIALSLTGSFFFQDVPLEPFHYNSDSHIFRLVTLENMPWQAVLCSVGLGFSLAILMLMDQNISSAMVNNPSNKLKKGPAYHWDLLVIGLINIFLSVFTLPWMHAAIPHSPLHMRNLADVEERVDQGHVHQIIVRVRETRLTGIFAHILIGFSILLLPYPLSYIPVAVLDGLFLYMAVTALDGNQMFERIILLFTEQAAYPPNHYIRRVPQRKVHQFTAFQVLQLIIMCSIGFVPWPYVKMIFPVILFLLLPIRNKLIPLMIEQKYLNALDGVH